MANKYTYICAGAGGTMATGLNIAMATERTYITVHPAINVHPVALIFVNIIVDQIWLKSTIFRLLMLLQLQVAQLLDI